MSPDPEAEASPTDSTGTPGASDKVGPYRIVELLGSGGMGRVYKAWDERLDRHVALKIILPEKAGSSKARRRFLREARVAARLDHPALIHIHDFLESDDGHWIVMEYVEGESLARWIEEGPPPLAGALSVACEIASGLVAIHAAGILHRDLKSENVIIARSKGRPGHAGRPHRGEMPPDHDYRGRVRILDFGLARPDDAEGSLSATDGLLGTPRAMSPEQVRGDELTPASDLFALGTLLYEILTGRSPFLGPGPLETLAKVCHDPHEPVGDLVAGLPPSLTELVDRLLAKDPAGRPEGSPEVLASLERIIRTTPDLGTEPKSKTPARRPGRTSQVSPGSGGGMERRGERRRVTVLCCELVEAGESGGDESSGSLDPEVLFEVLPSFQELSAEVVGRYEGHLGDFQGHRLVVLFGFPQTREDDPRRAALAALDLVELGGQLGSKEDDDRPTMAMRAGVHSGPAVVLTTPGQGERLVLGQTLDRATALQEQASPGSIIASSDTQPLIEGLFNLAPVESAGEVTEEWPEGAVRVIAARPIHSPLEGLADLPPPIGRARELDLLADYFGVAKEGVGQVVLMTGEAGMGKTRLVRALHDRLDQEAVDWLAVYGSPYTRHHQLVPIANLLGQLLGLGLEGPFELRREQLTQALESFDLPLSEVEPPLLSLFGLASPDSARSDSRHRQEIIALVPELLLEIVEQRADRQRATVLVFENLQWADPTSIEVISRLVDQCSAAPLFLVLTYRPSFQVSWGGRGHRTRLHLGPLGQAEARRLVTCLAGNRQLAADTEEAIVTRSAGVPLYIEELTRHVLASGAPDAKTLPPTLEGMLNAKLDRLGTAKDLAQLAAVLGPELSYQDLRSHTELDSLTLDHELERLAKAGILTREGGGASGRLGFSHPLLWEATLATLLEEDRLRFQRDLEARGGDTTLDLPPPP